MLTLFCTVWPNSNELSVGFFWQQYLWPNHEFKKIYFVKLFKMAELPFLFYKPQLGTNDYQFLFEAYLHSNISGHKILIESVD